MATLLAFDCDGTLDVSAGPVRLGTLNELAAQGYKVVMVSPSGNCKSLNFHHVDGPDRLANLKRVKELYPECDRWVYVSDNPGDDQLSLLAGYDYIHPSNFYSRPLPPP